MSRMTLLQAMADPNLFASWFRNRKTWGSWFVFLRALFELPMTSDQFKLYQRCTGRNSPPAKVASEAWLVICRRGGKSFILALVAVFLACFHSYRQFLAPGEKGTILIIATDRKQGRVTSATSEGFSPKSPCCKR